MRIAHMFRNVSGPSIDDCHVLADRWLGETWEEDHAESWVLQISDGRMHAVKVQVGWLTGIWRSPAGKVYVSEGSAGSGGIHVSPGGAPQAPQWDFHELPLLAMGVGGVDDRCVLTWGPRVDCREDGMFLWDGGSWRPIPCPGKVMSVHGTSTDNVYAVGRGGLVSRWDGTQWHAVPSSARITLTGIHVVGRDEQYACGSDAVMRGISGGWSEVALAPGAATNVAMFKDEILVAGEGVGLLRLKGDRLEKVEPFLPVTAMDTRWRLVVATHGELADSADGKVFRRRPLSEFVALAKGVPTMW